LQAGFFFASPIGGTVSSKVKGTEAAMEWIGEWWDLLIVRVGGYAVVIGAVGTAIYKGIQHFGSKWLDNRFEEKLKATDRSFSAQLKDTEQKHDVMVRHLQSSINREYERATQLHTKEFKALSKGWKVLHEAYWTTRTATGRGHSVHQFTEMSGDQATQFIINHTELATWQKDELLALERPQERDTKYREWWWWIQYQNCERTRMKLVMFIDRNAIFMQPEIREVFDRLERLIRDATIELEMRIRGARGENTFDRSSALAASEEPIYKELEAKIHKRLWSSVTPVSGKQHD
jgi:hypothetical protein